MKIKLEEEKHYSIDYEKGVITFFAPISKGQRVFGDLRFKGGIEGVVLYTDLVDAALFFAQCAWRRTRTRLFAARRNAS